MDALGNPIALALTPGQIHDLVPAPELLAQADPQAVIADKAFDADTFIDPLLSSGVVPVIPPRSSRKRVRSCDYALYRERNLVERITSNASEASQPDTTSSPAPFLQPSSLPPLPSSSTEDTTLSRLWPIK